MADQHAAIGGRLLGPVDIQLRNKNRLGGESAEASSVQFDLSEDVLRRS